MQICHDSQNRRYRTPFGAVACGQKVTLNLYAPNCNGVCIRLWQDGRGETMIPMSKSAALFSADIKVPEEPCVLWYFFVISFGDRVVCYGNNPESLGGEGCIYENSQPPSFQITVYQPFETPSWYKNGLVYQIFPDRFAKGADFPERKEAAALPEGWTGSSRYFEDDWNTIPSYRRDEKGNVSDWQFFGGTFRGICEKIPYLKSLGVTALYLNPITKAASNHRYDTSDYMTADPLLGDNEGFRLLADECRKNGIRIILDGVFSHTGADSIYFDKYGNFERLNRPEETEAGAFLHKNSKYRSWYRFKEEEPGYECWWGVTDLPNVEETDPSYDIFICGPGGVLENWISLGASGFRLDVADELPDSFIKNIRDALKEADPDSLLIGEVWEDASNKTSYGQLRKYFSGDELDGTMNYPFRDNAIDYFIGKEDAETFCKKMKSLKENYPKEAFYSSLNIIGGHDCERILSTLGEFTPSKEDQSAEDGTFFPKGSALSLDGAAYEKAKARLKMLSSLQYVMPGVPCIYYGDEAGIQGNKDPDNRRTYPWGKEDSDLLHHYRMLGVIYEEHPALKDGEFFITSKEGCLFVARQTEEETLLTIINPSEETKSFKESLSRLFGPEFKGGRFGYGLELLSSTEISLEESVPKITLSGLSSMLILLKEEAPEVLELSKGTGILCHLSSLPEDKELKAGKGGSDRSGSKGNISFDSLSDPEHKYALGRRGRAFIDWLSKGGFTLWQMLPVNPVGAGNSPYFSPCVFAGDTRFLDPEELPDPAGFASFCNENHYWLNDWAEYALEHEYIPALPVSLYGSRTESDIQNSGAKRDYLLRAFRYDQYVFYSQLETLKDYANSKGILLIGDLPIYAAPDGADLEAHPECFQTDGEGHLLNVGGVPPDYFSTDGQYWSNPLYDWDVQKQDDYEWWYQRLRLALKYFDYIRLDHFRSFSEYFAIPEGQMPKEGHWMHGPGLSFFRCMKERLGKLRIIAEDLGQLDSGVYNLIKLTGLPGMNIWQFHAEEMRAMGPKEIKNRIFYSGTHDNQTLVGWCKDSFPDSDPKEKAKEIMDELLKTEAPWVIFQLQDVLLLDDSARINVPGTVGENWTWQCKEELGEVRFAR